MHYCARDPEVFRREEKPEKGLLHIIICTTAQGIQRKKSLKKGFYI